MIQAPLFTTTKSTWTPPSMSALPIWAGRGRVAVDVETRDPQLKALGIGAGRRKDSYIVGASIAFEDGTAFYLPTRHTGGGNLDESQVMRYLRDNAAAYSGQVVGHNLAYDIDFLASAGVVFSGGAMFRDTMIAQALINENLPSYTLDDTAALYGLAGKDETMLRGAAADFKVNPKSGLWQLDAAFVGAYAEQDAALPLKLLRLQEAEIIKQDLTKIFDLESKLLPVLVKMRRRGVKVNFDKLARIEQQVIAAEVAALAEIEAATGYRIGLGNCWKAKALEIPLKHIGFDVQYSAAGNPTIAKDALAGNVHPVVVAIQRAREVSMIQRFVKQIRDHAVGDRIHCTFNQLARENDEGDGTTGARYGRLSATHPNMQNQPARGGFAKQWRDIYEPNDGQLWASNDYSQQEPRIAVHYAAITASSMSMEAATAAIRARDAYRNDPKCDNHQMMADMIAGRKATKAERTIAKTIYLGLSYGMGTATLCTSLGVQEEEGKALIDQFNSKVPFISALNKLATERANKTGSITTIGGRRCHFERTARGYDFTHKALNRLIQGSAADQTKAAMVALDAEGYDMIIQVHDEVALGVEDRKEAEGAAEIMENVVRLCLPSKVDVEIGKSWGESMGYIQEH